MSSATYDGSGKRTTDTITHAGGTASTQQFVWGSPGLLMDSTNAYIYAGSHTPAEQVNLSTGTVSYLITDSLGSVRGIVGSAGTLGSTTSYDAWGNPLTPGGLTGATPFGFAGGYTDATGLIYLINRYYDPATGQFISVDPEVGQTGQPYAYTGGDPVSEADPTGEQWAWIIKCNCRWLNEGDFEDEMAIDFKAAAFLDPGNVILMQESHHQQTAMWACPQGGGSCLKRIPDIYWWEPHARNGGWGFLNELKVGGASLTGGPKGVAMEVQKDKWLLDSGGGVAAAGTPYEGQWEAVNHDVWWFAPNELGKSAPSVNLARAIWDTGIIDIIIIVDDPNAPDWVQQQSRKERDREVQDLKSQNKTTAERGLASWVWGCGCA
jgi:RHS repeat-associated protein